MTRIAAYGTLREGMYNRPYFNMTFIKNTTITGFKLYDLGPYPMVIRTDDENDKLVVDVFEVDDRTLRALNGMEIGAGYSIDRLNIDDVDTIIYIFKNVPKTATAIGSDYVKYIKND